MIGYAASGKQAKLAPPHFQCNKPDAGDVQIDIMFCGVRHSNIQQVKIE